MRAREGETAITVQAYAPLDISNKKPNFETILALLLAIRLSGHTSGVASTDSTVSGPMLECIYGGAGLLVFFISITYDCVTDRSERVGRKKVFEGHFSDIKLQYFISYVLSLVGACMWMAETNKAAANQNKHIIIFAQLVLGASGFIVGKNAKEIARQAKALFRGRPQDMQGNGAVSHEPYAEEGNRDEPVAEQDVVETVSSNDAVVPAPILQGVRTSLY